jgi:hypothetical protein
MKDVGFGAWRLDLRTGALEVSEGLVELLGLATRPTENADLLARVSDDDRCTLDREVRAAIATRRAFRCEVRVDDPEGERWIEARGRATYAGETPIALLGTAKPKEPLEAELTPHHRRPRDPSGEVVEQPSHREHAELREVAEVLERPALLHGAAHADQHDRVAELAQLRAQRLDLDRREEAVPPNPQVEPRHALEPRLRAGVGDSGRSTDHDHRHPSVSRALQQDRDHVGAAQVVNNRRSEEAACEAEPDAVGQHEVRTREAIAMAGVGERDVQAVRVDEAHHACVGRPRGGEDRVDRFVARQPIEARTDHVRSLRAEALRRRVRGAERRHRGTDRRARQHRDLRARARANQGLALVAQEVAVRNAHREARLHGRHEAARSLGVEPRADPRRAPSKDVREIRAWEERGAPRTERLTHGAIVAGLHAATSAQVSASALAATDHERAAARFGPSTAARQCSSSSSTRLANPRAMSSASFGSKSTPRSPTTSGRAPVLEAATGRPHA